MIAPRVCSWCKLTMQVQRKPKAITITEAMVQAAAEAIRHTVANRGGRARSWASLPPALKESYRAEARAALEAALALQA